jgi:hypothetical protein
VNVKLFENNTGMPGFHLEKTFGEEVGMAVSRPPFGVLGVFCGFI